jgi:hypothetical protein
MRSLLLRIGGSQAGGARQDRTNLRYKNFVLHKQGEKIRAKTLKIDTDWHFETPHVQLTKALRSSKRMDCKRHLTFLLTPGS